VSDFVVDFYGDPSETPIVCGFEDNGYPRKAGQLMTAIL